MTVLFTELNRIIFTALYRIFSTSHGIEFMVNDRKIFYGLIPLGLYGVKSVDKCTFEPNMYSKWMKSCM